MHAPAAEPPPRVQGGTANAVLDVKREDDVAVVVDLTQEDEGAPVGEGAGALPKVAVVEDDEPVIQAPAETEEGIIYPRRVIVTPLRVLLYPAAPEVSNRILRRYSLPHTSPPAR